MWKLFYNEKHSIEVILNEKRVKDSFRMEVITLDITNDKLATNLSQFFEKEFFSERGGIR